MDDLGDDDEEEEDEDDESDSEDEPKNQKVGVPAKHPQPQVTTAKVVPVASKP